MEYCDITYYENKKRAGLIFTQHNIDEKKPFSSLNKEGTDIIREPDAGISWWDRDNGRYRTEIEQKEYVRYIQERNQRICREELPYEKIVREM